MTKTTATTLAELVTSAASRAPASDAIIDLTTVMSWSDVALETGRLGAALTAAGIGRGDRVGVHYRKSPEAFLAMHAVVQQGAIAVPLDPKASGEYLSSVADKTGCRALLTHQLCAPSALTVAQAVAPIATVIGLDPTPRDTGQEDTGPRDTGPGESATRGVSIISSSDVAALDPIDPVIVQADDPAYIITTSGSTGRPKGICHTHRSAMAYVEFKLAAYDLGPADRVSDIAPNHFDISTLALWVTPAIGASNVVVREQYQMLPASLSQLMADTGMTVFYGVPYLLTQLMARGSLPERALEQLRWVLFGGEVMSASILAELMEAIPNATFSNVYGPAEVNACAIHHLDKPPAPEDDIPIGGPVFETQIRLAALDGSGRGVASSGEKGEIWVKAPTMMAGYWDEPELDRRSITTDADGHWYRTGDLGWQRHDGALVFAGRVDHQVKVRGHRVELEAIESAIEELTEIAVAVATVGQTKDGSDVIIAGLAPQAPGSYDELKLADVAAHASGRLPAYACPSAWYQIPSMPTTGSGKVDRGAIRLVISSTHEQEKGGR